MFEQRPEFAGSLRGAKTLFVGVYHNLQSGLIDPPPPDSFDKVAAVLTRWPLASENEQAMLQDVKAQLSRWGQYRLTTDISKADLIIVVKLGRDKNDPIAYGGYWDIPEQFLWDDSLHLYALGVKPGLIWCGNEAGGLHAKGGNLPLMQKLEEDALHAFKTCPTIEVSVVADKPEDSVRHMTSDDGRLVSLNGKPLLTISDFTNATVSRTEGQIVLDVSVTTDGAKRMQTFTASNVGKRIAFVVNGRAIKIARIRDPITGTNFMLSPFVGDEAEKLADSINHKESGCRTKDIR
ncbi:MAG TPA: hypothetical protein VGN39_13845 [Terriglobales bacterium]|nr:hypothetical protein [Terriglobales bacterium]